MLANATTCSRRTLAVSLVEPLKNRNMKDKEKLLSSEFGLTFKILKSKNRVIILPPIIGFEIKHTAINVYETELLKTDFMFLESNDKIIFKNLTTDSFFGFDIDDINLDKIYFRFENGRFETFEVQDLKMSGDLQQYLD